MLGRIRDSAARMDQLITDILAYSTAQRAELSLRRLNLEAIVDDVWQTLLDAGPARRARLAVQPLPKAYGDSALVKQVLANLLGNAVKFSARKPDPQVEVGVIARPEGPAYYVRDNGNGFDSAKAESLFGAFTRLHAATEFEGNGLGLAIVKEVIARHGGRVWAEGSPGAGAAFYFTLPAPANAPDLEAVAERLGA